MKCRWMLDSSLPCPLAGAAGGHGFQNNMATEQNVWSGPSSELSSCAAQLGMGSPTSSFKVHLPRGIEPPRKLRACCSLLVQLSIPGLDKAPSLARAPCRRMLVQACLLQATCWVQVCIHCAPFDSWTKTELSLLRSAGSHSNYRAIQICVMSFPA